MVSLRSWYVSGWDISQEYQVFNFTKERLLWSMSNLSGHAYNSCLSITMLPTVFLQLLKINEGYIFKLLFQLIFGLVPLGIFSISRRYASNIVSFLGSFFFIAQAYLWSIVTTLARQEISFLFFALMILVLFEKDFKRNKQKALFLIFCFSMIVSHYSTTYISIALFSLTYLINLFVRKKRKFHKKNSDKLDFSSEKKPFLTLSLIIILIFSTFVWQFLVTDSADNLVNLVDSVILLQR